MLSRCGDRFKSNISCKVGRTASLDIANLGWNTHSQELVLEALVSDFESGVRPGVVISPLETFDRFNTSVLRCFDIAI